MDARRIGNLYPVVEAYSSIAEHHRSGCSEDATTADWFADELLLRGAQAVTKETYSFDRYRVHWALTAGGEFVEAIPLYYEGTGIVDTDCPAVGALEIESGALVGWESFVKASAESPAAIVATQSRTGLLFALNRRPDKGSGLLTLCVAPRELDRLRQ